MTPSSRLSAALHAIRWAPNDLAHHCGVNRRTPFRWMRGDPEPPEAIVAWCEMVARWLENMPAPPTPKGPRVIPQ